MKLLDYYFNLIPNKFIRFILVGGINTAFGMGMYCILIFATVPYTIATLIAHILGVFFNFFTTGKLVFNNSDKKLIFRFSLTYALTYFINIGINRLSQIILGTNEYWSGIFATIMTAFISFFIMKYFVYYKKSSNEKD